MAAASDDDGNGSAENRDESAADVPASVDTPQIQAKILNPAEALDEFYVDGALNLQVHDAIAKFEFFNIAAIDGASGEQSWRRTQRMVMPLTAAPRLMAMLQQMMAELQKSGRVRVTPQNQATDAE